MAKVLSIYSDFTADQLKARTSIPVQSGITVSGNTIICEDFDTTQIASVLGSAETDVNSLYTSALVNKWSNFSPIEFYDSGGGVILPRAKTTRDLSDFAGYNHNAYPPTYFNTKPTTWTATKTGSYVIAMGFDLRKGELPPYGSRSWSYVRVKIVLTDTTNSRTLTFYSPVQAVTTSASSFIASYTDATNVSIAGTAVVTAQYVSSDGGVLYGDIEDTYPSVTVNIGGYYQILYDHNFTVTEPTPPAGDIKIFYVNGHMTPSNSLINPGGETILRHSSHYLPPENPLFMINGATGLVIPVELGGDPSIQRWGVVIWDGGANYYRYHFTEYEGNDVFDTYRVDPALGYMYKLTYHSTLATWPTLAT
jgi:hypothetical protein